MENWGPLSHLFVTSFMYYFCELMQTPAIPDVTLAVVCPGEDECSAVIYLAGFQQVIGGIGSVVLVPLIGILSDAYGRKNLMMIPLVLAIIPNAVLAWKRTTNFFYAYFIIKTIAMMFTQSGYLCLALAYLADNVSEGKRVSAFGIQSGVLYAAFVGGTFAGRLLSTTGIFQVAAAISIVAAIYAMIFLKETTRKTGPLERPILKVIKNDEDGCETSKKMDFIGKIPSPRDIFRLLRSSVTLSLAAFVAFFIHFAVTGIQTCFLYFLKARFHYNKNELADISLISFIAAAISNVFSNVLMLVLLSIFSFLHGIITSTPLVV